MSSRSISPLVALYIVLGLLSTLGLLYFISLGIYESSKIEKIFQLEEEKNTLLERKRDNLLRRSEIGSTLEYQDRYNKEHYEDRYKQGEIVIILPRKEEKKEDFTLFSAEEIREKNLREKPIEDQWKSIFFKK